MSLYLYKKTTLAKLPNIKILVKSLKSSNFIGSEKLHKPTAWLSRYQNCRFWMYTELEKQKRTMFKRNILLLLAYETRHELGLKTNFTVFSGERTQIIDFSPLQTQGINE